MRSFLVALAFLTILPVRFRELPSTQVVARSRFWYPVIGLLLGALLGGWAALTGRLAAPALSAFLVLVAWTTLTGALHLDGLCDLGDALFSGHKAEHRLRIMKDPHLGTFGLAAGVLVLLGKFVMLQELADGALVIGAAVACARCLVLCMAAGAPYPRAEGTGKALVSAMRCGEAWLFAAVALTICLSLLGAQGLPLALTPVVAAGLLLLVLRRLCIRRLGGITGDCLGAGIEMGELVFLLAAVLVQRVGMRLLG